jgi:hypothetical protein
VITNNMLAGKYQMGYVGDMPAIVATTKRSQADIRIISVTSFNNQQCDLFVVRPDAPEFKTPLDAIKWMDGKKVAVPKGSCTDRFAQEVFKRANVKPAEYLNESIEVITTNLRAGNLDAAVIWEPNVAHVGEIVGNKTARLVSTGADWDQHDTGLIDRERRTSSIRTARGGRNAEGRHRRAAVHRERTTRKMPATSPVTPSATRPAYEKKEMWYALYGRPPVGDPKAHAARFQAHLAFDDPVRAFLHRRPTSCRMHTSSAVRCRMTRSSMIRCVRRYENSTSRFRWASRTDARCSRVSLWLRHHVAEAPRRPPRRRIAWSRLGWARPGSSFVASRCGRCSCTSTCGASPSCRTCSRSFANGQVARRAYGVSLSSRRPTTRTSGRARCAYSSRSCSRPHSASRSAFCFGWNRVARDFLFPLLELIRPIPPLAWVPLAILMLSGQQAAMIFLTWIAAFFATVLNTMLGVTSIDESYLRAAYCLGSRRWDVLWNVVVPGALPYIFTGLQIGMGVAWFSSSRAR